MEELERAVSRMFCIGFDGYDLTPAARQLIARGVSSVVLFARNVDTPMQVAQLCASIKRETQRPILTCIDQEGGRVRRLRDGFTQIPSMRVLGQTGDADLAYDVGQVLARELRAVNIDLNFAPTLDVDTNPDNPVIGDRSFGTTSDLVSRMGTAVLRGLQDGGVAACGKHFPGHGDTSQDSHHDLPRLPHPIERLQRIELPPFQAAVDAGVAMLMTAHVVFEPIDDAFPATMSRAVLEGILRRQMGFDGVIVSDDLEMKAISANYEIAEVVERGANAGVDLFVICHDTDLQVRAIDALLKAVTSGRVPRSAITDANRRITTLMQRFARPPLPNSGIDTLNSPAHRAVMRRLGPVVESPAQADPTQFVA